MSDNDALRALLTSEPGRATELLARLKPYVVVPHPGQVPVVESKARFKVLNCGRRWGKTKIGVKSMLDVAKTKDNSLVWWVAPTYRVVKRGYRETLKQLPKDYLTHEPPPDSNFDSGRPVVLRLKNGANIEFYSAERPAGMLGEGVDFVVQDEAASTPSMVWEQIIRPTLADKLGGAMLISTPRGRNWFYKRWLNGQDPDDPDWESWTRPSYTNPYLKATEIEALRRELPSLLFSQEVEAKFLAAGSSVFRFGDHAMQLDQVLENNLVEGVAPEGQVFLGVDLAKTTDYTVFYGARDLDGRNVYYERLNMVSWPEQKRRLARAVRTIRKAGAENVTLVMDSTGVGDPIQEDMEELGYDVIPINFTGTKNKMVVLLAKDLEENKSFILDERVEEFEAYAMDMTPSGRITYGAPEGEHDDVVSAKMLQHFALINEGAPNIVRLEEADPPRPSDFPGDGGIDSTQMDDEDLGSDWDDLVDNEGDGGLYFDDEEAWIEDQVSAPARPPTPEELLNREEVWAQ